MVNMNRREIFFIYILWFVSCTHRLSHDYQPDIQGHRGCRGLMPENTIEGFIHAVDLGVHTLELDVVISKDSQVVVSHEPFFSHKISTAPTGIDSITAENEKEFNLYKMDYNEIRSFNTGIKDHPGFPLQSKFKTYKPTLAAVIDTIEKYILMKGLKNVFYNIEIKYQDGSEGKFHPSADKMVALVYHEVIKLKIKDKCNIQSFNPLCLNVLQKMDATIHKSLLVENMEGHKKNLEKLSFKPNIYSPHFKLVNKELLDYCKSQQIKLIPWTVNEEKDIVSMLKLQVDGIISDYPDKVIELLASLR